MMRRQRWYFRGSEDAIVDNAGVNGSVRQLDIPTPRGEWMRDRNAFAFSNNSFASLFCRETWQLGNGTSDHHGLLQKKGGASTIYCNSGDIVPRIPAVVLVVQVCPATDEMPPTAKKRDFDHGSILAILAAKLW